MYRLEIQECLGLIANFLLALILSLCLLIESTDAVFVLSKCLVYSSSAVLQRAAALPSKTRPVATGFAGGRKDTIAGLVLCAPSLGWVDLSVINGEIIVKDGQLLTLNLQVSKHSTFIDSR